jgi:ribulose-5-phosphate 4-epimerase/fuculose-1-phosphate aldolase
MALPEIPNLQGEVSEAEWEARCDLAAAYRHIAREGWDDMLSPHLSARVPDDPDKMLLNPYGFLFCQMTASSLIKVDMAGKVLSPTPLFVNPAAVVIHGGILEAREDVASVMHLHTVDGVAVSTHADGLLPLNQRALYFQEILAYHDYEGIALDDDERVSLARDLGDKWLLMLRNHGTLSVGRTVGQAYTYLYFLEMACKYQTRTLSCGVDLIRLPPDVIEKVPKQATHIEHMGTMEWPALRAVLDVAEPEYAT